MDRECSVFLVRRLSRQVTQFYDHVLRSHGLKSTQYHLLTVLWEEGPLSIGELAGEVGAERTSTTRAVQAVASRGLLAVEPGADGRSKSVRLRSKGRALLERIEPIRRKREAAFREELDGVTTKAFLRDLERAANKLQELNERGDC